MSDFNGWLTESNGIKIEWYSVMDEGYVKTPFQLHTILIYHLIYTLTMLRTPARQAILAASRSTRSSIITRSLSTAPKRASVLYVPLSVFVLTIDPELSSSQSLCLGLDSILPLFYVVRISEKGVGGG